MKEKKSDSIVWDENHETYFAKLLPYATSPNGPIIEVPNVDSFKKKGVDKVSKQFQAELTDLQKKIKSLAAAYYGRIKSYETALKEGDIAIKQSLTRNLYCDGKPTERQLSAMTKYLLALYEVTNNLNFRQISSIDFVFPFPLGEWSG